MLQSCPWFYGVELTQIHFHNLSMCRSLLPLFVNVERRQSRVLLCQILKVCVTLNLFPGFSVMHECIALLGKHFYVFRKWQLLTWQSVDIWITVLLLFCVLLWITILVANALGFNNIFEICQFFRHLEKKCQSLLTLLVLWKMWELNIVWCHLVYVCVCSCR